jgi:hypothetical protein
VRHKKFQWLAQCGKPEIGLPAAQCGGWAQFFFSFWFVFFIAFFGILIFPSGHQ